MAVVATLIIVGCATMIDEEKECEEEMGFLEILGKSIDLKESELLFEEDFSST